MTSHSWVSCALATLAFSSILAGADAKFLSSRPTTGKSLHLEFQSKKASVHPNKRSPDYYLRKRSESIQVNLDNLLTYYNIEVEVGTPAQTFNLLIDTGSSDMWIIGEGNEYCSTSASAIADGTGVNCTISGVFNSSSSSTYHKNNTDFFISYGDQTVAEGDWVMDTLTLDGNKIKDMSFGLGSTTNSSMGVLGIGYSTNEATLSTTSSYTYENLPLRLVSDGLINTPAYSLWLNDINADRGNILFGAVDHDKYSGSLTSMKIQSLTNSDPSEFLIDFSSLTFKSGDTSTDVALNSSMLALLDSGTSLTYFPSDIASSLFDLFNASYSKSIGYYLTSCDLEGSLEYSFSGANISVPFSSLLIPVTDETGATAKISGNAACAVGILEASYEFALLGDTFLRSAYVVYDLKNNKIAMAQTASNVTSSDIEVISDTIPSTPSSHTSGTESNGAYSSGEGSSTDSSASSTGHKSSASLTIPVPPVAFATVLFIFCISTFISLV